MEVHGVEGRLGYIRIFLNAMGVSFARVSYPYSYSVACTGCVACLSDLRAYGAAGTKESTHTTAHSRRCLPAMHSPCRRRLDTHPGIQ